MSRANSASKTKGRTNSKAARGQQADPASGGGHARWLLSRLAWLGMAGLWAFVVLALISFHPGDAPTHLASPANPATRNWMGPVGAHAAYALLRLLGYGVVPVLVAWLVAQVWTALGRPAERPILRATGTLLLATAFAALAQLIVPDRLGPMPAMPGGMVGVVIADLSVPSLGEAGTTLWVTLLVIAALLVTFDRLVIDASRRLAGAIGRGTRRAASGAAGGVRTGVRRGAELAASRQRRGEPEGRSGGDADEGEAEAEADEGWEWEEWDEDEPADHDSADEELDADESEEDAAAWPSARGSAEGDGGEDDAEGAGAPQVFDREKLREKVSALPVRFASTERSAATDADLTLFQSAAELEGYRFPGLDLLEEPDEAFGEKLEQHVRDQAASLENALRHYRIKGEVVGIESGPVITLYHVKLEPGTKVARLNAVASDLARSLKSVNVRIVANMQGRDTVGIEVPNATKEKVRLKELMSSKERFEGMKLPMFLGKDASGEPLIEDLARMPHVLIAGTTGSGKSVCMNTIIMSFLYTKKPNELKLVLVDPKMVEMSQFKDIPHLMCPVVTEMAKAAAILEWAVGKMDERYELLAEAGCRDISGYNALEWEELKERFEPATEQEEARIPRKLPYMVFIIDELADLMMTNKEVEGSIIRIAQKARAVGIHLILATQRPQANVVTGLIKGNMPCRISFKVASGLDSRIVLDQKGGELLLGQGDMLFLSPSEHKLMRSQGTLVDDQEIRRVTRFMRDVARPTFERSLVQMKAAGESGDEQRLAATENNSSASLAAAQEDPLFDRAVEIVLETKRGSVSLLQRRLAIGYTRASRLIDLMGIAGIIGEHKGSVAREVLISPEEWAAIKEMAEEMRRGGQQGELFPGGSGAGDPGPESGRPAAAEPERHAEAAEDDVAADPDSPVRDAEPETAVEVVGREAEDDDAPGTNGAGPSPGLGAEEVEHSDEGADARHQERDQEQHQEWEQEWDEPGDDEETEESPGEDGTEEAEDSEASESGDEDDDPDYEYEWVEVEVDEDGNEIEPEASDEQGPAPAEGDDPDDEPSRGGDPPFEPTGRGRVSEP